MFTRKGELYLFLIRTALFSRNDNVVSTMKECADVLRQILNSPQHPTVKNWCAEIIHVVSTHVEEEEPTTAENNEQINDEYLEVSNETNVYCSGLARVYNRTTKLFLFKVFCLFYDISDSCFNRFPYFSHFGYCYFCYHGSRGEV